MIEEGWVSEVQNHFGKRTHDKLLQIPAQILKNGGFPDITRAQAWILLLEILNKGVPEALRDASVDEKIGKGTILKDLAKAPVRAAAEVVDTTSKVTGKVVGGAVGAALAYWYHELEKPRIEFKDQMKGSFLGPKFTNNHIENKLKFLKANYKKHNSNEIVIMTAKELSKEKTVGWFQGRMEFGPRALGCRSILGDPRSDKMQKNLNLKVKYRESFRPFAPSILREDLNDWFDINVDSPYMLMVSNINKDKVIDMTEDQTDAVQGLGIDPYDLSGESHRMHAMQLSDPAVKEIFDSKAWDKICKRAEEVKLRVRPAVPSNLKAELRPYQVEGFHFLSYLF